MSRWRFINRGALLILKLLCLALPAGMAAIQVRELRYDYGSKTPVPIESPEELHAADIGHATFVRLAGKGDFDHAFIMHRYGISYTYFLLEPYGRTVVVRTYQPVDDNWRDIRQFVGKLRPFDQQPFSYRVRESFAKQYGVDIPADAYFLALYDVPKPDGWQIAAVVFSTVLFLAMLYFFFLRRKKVSTPVNPAAPSGPSP